MSIKNRGTNASPSYEVRVSIWNPKTRKPLYRKRKNIPNLKEAKRIEEELRFEAKSVARGLVADKTFRAIAYQYLKYSEERGTLAASTLHAYRVQIEGLAIKRFGNWDIDTIKKQDILDLLENAATERSWDQDTVKRNRDILKNVFAFAKDVLEIQIANPVTEIRTPKKRSRKTVMWSREQIKQFLGLLETTSHPLRYLWKWSVYTGCRNGESFCVCYKNIDWENATVTISQSWHSKAGFKSTKTGEIRTIDLAPPVMKMLRELKVASGGRQNDFVLPRHWKWDKGRQSEELSKFLMGTGLPIITHHDLRAVWCSWSLLSNVPWHLVQMQGGWRDYDTIAYYARAAGVDVQGSLSALNFEKPKGEVIPLKKQQ